MSSDTAFRKICTNLNVITIYRQNMMEAQGDSRRGAELACRSFVALAQKGLSNTWKIRLARQWDPHRMFAMRRLPAFY